MAQSRVPAWKRLGLKLKFARDVETPSSALGTLNKIAITNGGVSAGVSTNAADRHSLSDPPSKRRRVEDKADIAPATSTKSLTRTSSLKSSGGATRKSVSFTPETKEDDGESSSFMRDKWDEEARNDQINDFLAREAEKAETSLNAQTTKGFEVAEPAENVKIAKKGKNGSAGVTTSPLMTTRKSTDALDYLQQYRSSRSSWKFNKNREVWLLKHILSTKDIPREFEAALIEYLSGIKSENARSRIINQCHDCIVAEVEAGSDESDQALVPKSLSTYTATTRLSYYEAARQRVKDALESPTSGSPQGGNEARKRYERVDRAAKLLESMLNWESSTHDTANTEEMPERISAASGSRPVVNCNIRKCVPKKRKNRTAVVEIQSSSSEDISTESSSDDSSTN